MADGKIQFNVKAEIDKAEEYLRNLGDDSKYIRKNLLRSIGVELKKETKKSFPPSSKKYFKQSKNIKRSLRSVTKYGGKMVAISSDATNEKGVRYPFVLAHGIKPKQRNWKWKEKHPGETYMVKPRAFMGSAYYRLIENPSFPKFVEKAIDKEIKSWERKQQRLNGGSK